MAWIDVIGEDEAEGELKAVYDRLIAERGKVANILRVHSLNPGAMDKHLGLYMHLLFGRSKLSRAEREAIAVVTSRANDCDYCVAHHAEALARYERDNERLQQIAADYTGAELTPRLRAILDYAHKLTQRPGKMEEADVEALREVGLTDAEILDTNLVCCYFNFVNRIALGLGVESSEEEVSGYHT